MSERRRGLGRGLGALIPPGPAGADRPSDVFFPRQTDVSAGQSAASALLTAPVKSSPPATDESGSVSETTSSPATDGVTESADQASSMSARDGDEAATSVPDVSASANDTSPSLTPVPGAEFAELPVEQVVPNARQPRQVFDEDDLAELEHSIREIGVLQPVVVRRTTGGYELIMGERRLRAARAVGLETIPAIVRDTADDDMLRDALLENLHRAQLNPLEEAAAYQQLLDDFGCTHEVLAQRIGRSRPQISNTIRLLKLPPLVQRRVASGVLSAGHARALLGLEDGAAMERLAQRIVAEGLSVRTVEEIVLLGGDGGARKPATRRRRELSPQLQQVADDLSERLDTRVQVVMGRHKGRITVEFAGQDDLDRILQALGKD